MKNVYREHPGQTAQMVGGVLIPHPAAQAADVVVWFALPPEDDERVWEGLSAQKQDDGSAVVCAVPLFAYDLNFGDSVAVVASAEGPLVATEVVSDAGNYTFRIALQPHGAALSDLVQQFGAMGCLIEGWSESLLGLSCPATLAHSVADALAEAETQELLVYETGRSVPDPGPVPAPPPDHAIPPD